MQRVLSVVLALIGGMVLLSSGCSRAQTPTEAAAESAGLPAYDGPEQKPVSGQGSGVAVNITLRRGSERIGQGGSTPTWEVGLDVANFTDRPVAFGETLIVLEIARGSEETLGLYMARSAHGASNPATHIDARYGLDWGVSVGAGESTPWPWGAVTGRMSTSDTFMLLLSAPWARGFARGGFPTAEARNQYSLTEKIMAPIGLRLEREAVIVIAPLILARSGQPALQPIAAFEASSSGEFTQAKRMDIEVTEATLAPLVGATSEPLWKRTLALTLFAQSDFRRAERLLTSIAADDAAPVRLRASAMLNLAVNRHAASIPLMQRIYASPGDPRLSAIAIEALGEIGDAAAAPTVRQAISTADITLRRTAIRNAGRLRDAEAVPLIVAAMGAERDEGFGVICVEALAAIGTTEAWTAIVDVATDERAAFQKRRTAIEAIGEHKYGPGETALISLLGARGADRSIQLNAINALAHFDDEAAIAAITAATASRQDQVASSAVRALARVASPRARSALIAIVGAASHAQSAEAIRQLGATKDAAAVAPLRAVLSDSARSPAHRSAAFIAIKAIDPSQITGIERSMLWAAFAAAREERVAEEIARALIGSGFDDRSAVASLVAGLDERRNDAWYANVLLLRHLTGQQFGPEHRYGGNRESREAEFARWRAWAAENDGQ